MSQTLEIAVAVIFAGLCGIVLCLVGVFCVFAILGMRKLQDAATKVVAATDEMLREVKLIYGQQKEVTDRNFGEGSPLARSAKAVTILSNTLPEVMAGLKVFNEVFGAVYKTTFQPEKVARPASTTAGDDSQFIPYSEEAAANFERVASTQSQKLTLTDEELLGMRTDVSAVPQEPTPAS